MTEPLLTIGAFARAVGLTPSALRHYDECGLLPPAEVDHVTGYRYYTPDLVRRADLVAGMREAGVPIETMRAVLDGPVADARRVLEAYVDELAVRSARARAAVATVLSCLDSIGPTAEPAAAVVPGTELAAALRQVRAAADAEPASPLASVLLDLADGSLDVVATNRYWMAVRTVPVAGAGLGRAVVPVAHVPVLADRLDHAEDVRVALAGAGLDVDGVPADTRDVAYPAHRIVLAGLEPPRTHALLDVGELTGAVEAVARAEVTLALGADGARVAGGGPSVPVAGAVRGAPVEVRLGAALLRRALGAVLGPEVALEVSLPERAVVLRSPYQRGFVALVMPIGQG